MTLLELAERCEKARGPDQEIDALIAVAASKEPTARVAYMAGRRWYKKPGAGRIPFAGAFGSGVALGMIFQDRRYTASIDAALTLVPEGLHFEVATTGFKPDATVCGDSLIGLHGGAYAATPALALCAAALRARAQQESRP